MVEGISYKGWKIKIDPVMKYPGSFVCEYKYMCEKINTKEDIKNGAKGSKTLIPIKLYRKNVRFTGFDNLTDFRYQCTRKEVETELKRIVDTYDTKRPTTD
jgi:hypothetical protein